MSNEHEMPTPLYKLGQVVYFFRDSKIASIRIRKVYANMRYTPENEVRSSVKYEGDLIGVYVSENDRRDGIDRVEINENFLFDDIKSMNKVTRKFFNHQRECVARDLAREAKEASSVE